MSKINCPECEGTGLSWPTCTSDCEPCAGTGQIDRPTAPEKHTFPQTLAGCMMEAVCELEDLNDWEIQFVNDMAEQVLDGFTPTAKQSEVLKRMLEKADMYDKLLLRLNKLGLEPRD